MLCATQLELQQRRGLNGDILEASGCRAEDVALSPPCSNGSLRCHSDSCSGKLVPGTLNQPALPHKHLLSQDMSLQGHTKQDGLNSSNVTL